MSTSKPSAIAAAASELVNGDTPKTIKPRNTRATKPQGESVITWARAESTLIDAVKGQMVIEKKWTLCSDILWGLGVRADHLDPVKDAKGNKKNSEMWEKLAGMVIKAFTPKAQALISAPILSLDPDSRKTRRMWIEERDKKMGIVAAYLKRHEKDESTGPKAKSTFGEIIAKVLQEQIDRINKKYVNKPDDIDFEKDRVIELLEEAVAELT